MNRQRIALLPALAAFCLLVTEPPTMSGKDPINGFIDCFGYGYRVRVLINGTAINVIHGEGQQATRLFSADHPMAAKTPADKKDIFILREGENTLQVEFVRLKGAQSPLQVKLEIPGRYAVPLFHLTTSTTDSAMIRKTVRIEKKMPAKFTTIAVTDSTMKHQAPK